MQKRELLKGIAAASITGWLPSLAISKVVEHAAVISLRIVDGGAGKDRYLCGHVGRGTVDLAPELSRKYSGTKWKVRRVSDDYIALQCLGLGDGPRWLECRTTEPRIALAQEPRRPYSSTAWRALVYDNSETNFALECAESHSKAWWLRGTPSRRAIDLVPVSYDKAQPGTKCAISRYPVCIDLPCDPWFLVK